MRLARFLLAFGALGLAVASGTVAAPALRAQAQAVHLPPQIARLREWADAVRLHAPGKADSSVEKLAKWPAADLESTLDTLTELRDALARAYPRTGGLNPQHLMKAPGGPAFPAAAVQEMLGQTDDEARQRDANRLLKRGALLHTDIAILVSADVVSGRSPAAGEARSIRLVDGRRQGADDSLRHWTMATGLMDGVTPEPSRDEVVRLWYLAAAEQMRAHKVLEAASTLLDHGRDLFPRDAQLAFYSGCLNEVLASPVVQNALAAILEPVLVRSGGATSRGSLITPLTPPPRTYWVRAESHFHASLRMRPDWPEARLRLGRVLGLLGRHEDAAVELRTALDATSDSLLAYYASLFLGGEEQALGHVDAARTAYERALEYQPRAQAPQLALSLLARSAGDRSRALAGIRMLLAQPPHDAVRYDPLWDYFAPKSATAGELFAPLWALVAGASR